MQINFCLRCAKVFSFAVCKRLFVCSVRGFFFGVCDDIFFAVWGFIFFCSVRRYFVCGVQTFYHLKCARIFFGVYDDILFALCRIYFVLRVRLYFKSRVRIYFVVSAFYFAR